MEEVITNAIRSIVQEQLKSWSPPQTLKIEPVPPFRLYSTRSTAKILDRSQDFVLDLIHRGALKNVVDLGGHRAAFRIRADEIQRFIDSRTIPPA